jgi:hypothetical protein
MKVIITYDITICLDIYYNTTYPRKVLKSLSVSYRLTLSTLPIDS